ncbi:hypothetical protein SAMN04488128_107220 [Chitinophaga eiseniae]|uniref:Uncharacterized protein n=1 Tax=Chitinophaga eiseniae TaxID=634771 RepID=A0A1T4U136_9BACT|nr:hypothetical protein [Chitinophaga eiseniae]SKA46198.1 hypothetical protein SAMN04488128_107220 [Chitinophaga eiseniae]
MSVNNIKIYDIFRKDLHLEDAKAQELLSEMDAAYSKDLLKTDIQQLSTKLVVVDTKLDKIKEDLDGFKENLNNCHTKLDNVQLQIQTDFKEICSKMSNTGLLQYVTITGTILGIIWTYFKFFK